MSSMVKKQLLTDMEGAAFAILARTGPSTSYAIARAFADSPSEYWSGSAGAVYPMLKRLKSRGLVATKQSADGKRAKIEYRVTVKGHAAFEAWLLDAKRGAGWGFDPLRARAMELDLVSATKGRRFLQKALAHTEALLREAPPNLHARERTIRHAWLKARISWLREALST